METSMTIPGVLSSAGDVVGGFGDLIVLVVGLALGFAVVGWIISKARSAKRG